MDEIKPVEIDLVEVVALWVLIVGDKKNQYLTQPPALDTVKRYAAQLREKVPQAEFEADLRAAQAVTMFIADKLMLNVTGHAPFEIGHA